MTHENLLSAGDSTTPAENTKSNSLRALVDWVSCSFVLDVKTSEIFNLIGISDLTTLEEISGARYEFAGYDLTYKLGAIELMKDTSSNRWLLNMSGQGCRQFEISSSLDMVTMFAMLANVYATYTRLDIAIDDFKGIYDTETIRRAVYNKQCVTKLKRWGNGTRGFIEHGNDFLTMDNFYLGDSSSRYFLNVYDKKIEQEEKEKDLPLDQEGQAIKSWTRTEIRFKYEYAQEFVVHILRDSNSLGFHIKSFLNDKIQFLTKSALKKDTNKSRLTNDKNNITKWWRTFLNGAGRLHLTVYKPDKTLKDSLNWVDNQVSTTLAMALLYEPEKYDEFIRSVTISGLDKMKKKHFRKVDNQKYIDNQNLGDVWVSSTNQKVEVKTPKLEDILSSYWEQVEEQQKIEDRNNLLLTQKKDSPKRAKTK